LCREAVQSMQLPAAVRKELSKKMEQAGIPLPETEDRWAQAEAAIIGVWASKFNDRAYFSMRKVGLDFMDLRMAVLVQRVVPAEYAFVIHTVNPSSGAPSRCCTRAFHTCASRCSTCGPPMHTSTPLVSTHCHRLRLVFAALYGTAASCWPAHSCWRHVLA
jgi:hypothetical protein